VVALLVTSITALGIFRTGVFFFAHWFAVAALIAIAAGITAAHFKIPPAGWIHLHLTCMLVSLYILIGGGVNEVFLRVNFLRQLIPNFNSPLVGMAHFAVMIFFAGLIAYFNAAILIRCATSVALRSWVGRMARQSQFSNLTRYSSLMLPPITNLSW